MWRHSFNRSLQKTMQRQLTKVNSPHRQSFQSIYTGVQGGGQNFPFGTIKTSHYYIYALELVWSVRWVFIMLAGTELGGFWILGSGGPDATLEEAIFLTGMKNTCNIDNVQLKDNSCKSSLCVLDYCTPLCMNLQGCTLSWLELSWGPQGVIRTPCTFCWTPTTAALIWDPQS